MHALAVLRAVGSPVPVGSVLAVYLVVGAGRVVPSPGDLGALDVTFGRWPGRGRGSRRDRRRCPPRVSDAHRVGAAAARRRSVRGLATSPGHLDGGSGRDQGIG
jgi:hypothetical protein